MSHDGNVAMLIIAGAVTLWCSAVVAYALVNTRNSYREIGLPGRGKERL